MRKILFATVAIAAFVFVTATPQQAKASWLSEYLHQRLDPGYGRSASVPGYDHYAPGYDYTPRYYTVPSYSYNFVPSYLPNLPSYYGPAYSYYRPGFYGSGWRDSHEWREHHGDREWHEHHGDHDRHEHHDGHGHHH